MTTPTRLGLDDLNDIPTAAASKPRHSWIPQSLIALAANPPAPPSIGALLYPGKRTLLSGETESLKTWLALILAKAEMALEIPVAWVDLDDMGAGAVLQRLRALQVPDQQINDLFLYYQPDQRLQDRVLEEVILQLTVTNTRLMVIDAFTGALHLHGLDPNKSSDIETFWREITDPISKTGTAPCVLDHVVKNPESRGKYATGSERKASGATVHLGTHSLTQLSVGGTGRTLLTVHKDRPGYLPRPALGVLALESDGNQISYALEPDRSHTPDGFRPTILMERISTKLEIHDEPASQTWIETEVTGNAKAKRTALQILTYEGYIEHSQGPRNSNIYTTLKPYRQADDDTPDTTPSTPSSTPSNPVQIFLVSSVLPDPVPRPLPTGRTGSEDDYGGEDGVMDAVTPSNPENSPNGVPPELLEDTAPEPGEPDQPANPELHF